MHYKSNSYNSSRDVAWDPVAVLELPNRSAYGITCIGWAKTKGRRCERHIANFKVDAGVDILRRLGNADKAAASPEKLSRAADLLLCWQHKNQHSNILNEWDFMLEDWMSDDSESCSSAYCNKTNIRTRRIESEPRVKKESLDEIENVLTKLNQLLELLEEMQRQRQEEEVELREAIRRQRQEEEVELREAIQRQIQRQEEEERQEKRRKQEEKKKREEERRREEQARDEERRREEQKREERRREEQKQKEEKAREEAFRERVRLAKEKRQQQAREKAQKEAAEWQAAWKCYSDGWTKGADLSVTNIAWPVKSGLQSDVYEANIRLFFEKAPPEELVDSGEKMFRLINIENKRWHTDKVMQRYGPDVVNGEAKAALAIVAKVMIELRQEAQKKR